MAYIPTFPGQPFSKFQPAFYYDPTDDVFKAVGMR